MADTGLDVTDLTENELSEGDPIGDPHPFGFECFQNGVTTIPEIGENVVLVESVVRIERCGGTADQHNTAQARVIR